MTARSKPASESSAAARRYIALLRGINVGGKNILPMRELQALLSDAGGTDVRTFIQSGNALFTATPTIAVKIARAIPAMIEKRFGFRPPVVVRSANELDRVITANPFVHAGAEAAELHVGFLSSLPEARLIAGLDANRSPGDSFSVQAVGGGAIYLRLSNGAADTKLTNAYFDKALATVSTFRNWRTTLKLLELAKAEASGHVADAGRTATRGKRRP